MKVSMESYLPNAPINLRLNFNFEKLVKCETSLCAVLLRLGLKGVKIFWNVSKVCMHTCSSNGHPDLWSNLNSKKLLESETPSCSFSRFGLKGGQNSSKCRESCMQACLSNMHPNLWSSFNSKNLVKVETTSCSFVRVWIKDSHALLSSKCAFKSMIKF